VTGISIAQIALNGITSNLSKSGVVAWIGELFPDRWGLAAAASSIDLRGIDGIRVSPDALWHHTTGQWLNDVAVLTGLGAVYLTAATFRLRARLQVEKKPRRSGKDKKDKTSSPQQAADGS
jgi:ABC transport system ATP-binding/permease protein